MHRTPEEKDGILEYMIYQGKGYFVYTPNMDKTHLAVLDLLKAGYVEKYAPHGNSSQVKITEEGKVFWMDGGYTLLEELKEIEEKNKLVAAAEAERKETEKFEKAKRRHQIIVITIAGIFLILIIGYIMTQII